MLSDVVFMFIIAKSGAMTMLDKHLILAVHITERLKHAIKVQNILSEFGDVIKTRLGLHDVAANSSSSQMLRWVRPSTMSASSAARLAAFPKDELTSV